MKLDELYRLLNNKKEDFLSFSKANFSKCYKDYFQISLVKNNKPYILSNIHYEITKGEKEDSFIFNIHFEEFDTTRYKNNKQLTELADKNQLEYFSWWTGKTKKNNQNNQSLKSKNIIIKTEEDTEKFINYLNDIFNQFNDLLLEIEENRGNVNMKTKNIILYGAPGVGKTHNYKKLVALIEGGDFREKEIFDFIINNKDDEILEGSVDELYNTVKNEKRIEFLTFHQSYSYEDFIEGFRPQDDGNIKLEEGIFKKLCEEAEENLENSKKEDIVIIEEVTFKHKLDSFIEKLEDEIEKNGYYQITDSAYINSIDIDAFRYNIRRENPTYKYDLRMKFEDLFEFEKNKVISRQDVKRLETVNSLANQHATYYFKVFSEISKINNISTNNGAIQKMEQKNFYIVIDEINRGNISKIFGELITLIEEDKRGKDEYRVKLPYSKKTFLVPSNLYIIATMNSTDKSIATIDIALRRRFTFLKMKPNLDLVENKEAKKLMKDLNEHISKTINEDYALGHSYFMKIENEDDFEFVKEYKIKPLLEEYFYGDEKNFEEAKKILNIKKDNP